MYLFMNLYVFFEFLVKFRTFLHILIGKSHTRNRSWTHDLILHLALAREEVLVELDLKVFFGKLWNLFWD